MDLFLWASLRVSILLAVGGTHTTLSQLDDDDGTEKDGRTEEASCEWPFGENCCFCFWLKKYRCSCKKYSRGIRSPWWRYKYYASRPWDLWRRRNLMRIYRWYHAERGRERENGTLLKVWRNTQQRRKAPLLDNNCFRRQAEEKK